jgi:hypothetical protein
MRLEKKVEWNEIGGSDGLKSNPFFSCKGHTRPAIHCCTDESMDMVDVLWEILWVYKRYKLRNGWKSGFLISKSLSGI